jgi:hypothetical protein
MTATPSFSWNAVHSTSHYLLRIVDRDNAITDRWYQPSDAGCPLGTDVCDISPGITVKAGLATWMVLTWNASGYGPWSDERRFLVAVPDPSAAVPAQVSPTGTITGSNVTYTWTSVAGAIAYRLSIRNNGGPAMEWWFTSTAAGCDGGGLCSATPVVELVSGTAEWQVQAWTDVGHSSWSPPIIISVPAALVDGSVPAAPVLVSPSGTTTSTPTFTWNASAAATYYYVQIYDSSGLRADPWVTPEAVGCSSGTETCTFSPGIALTSGAGSWQVLAWNPTGYSPWSSLMTFLAP